MSGGGRTDTRRTFPPCGARSRRHTNLKETTMADVKKSEWQVIVAAQKKALAARTTQLRAARLERDAALPPPAPVVRRAKKKPA